MMAVAPLLDHPVAQALAWALVHFLWQGALIGLAAALTVRVCSMTASVRYSLGVVAMASMLAAPVATTIYLARPTAPVSFTSAGNAATLVAPQTVVSDETTGTAPAPSSMPAAVTPAATRVPAMSLVLGLWFLGVTVLSLRLLGGWILAQRAARRAIRPVAPAMHALARRVAGRLALDRVVRVVESTAVSVPMMIGWLRPVVLLPAVAISGLSTDQVEALLAHELAHVRRHDYLVNLMQSLVETLLFYHPAVWIVSRQVRADREHCCDDLAIEVCDRLVYVSALADLAAMAGAPRLALAATDGSLLSRVRRLLGRRHEPASPRPVWLPLAVLALLTGAIVPAAYVSARASGAGQQSTSGVTVSGSGAGSIGAGVSGGIVGGVTGAAGVAGVTGVGGVMLGTPQGAPLTAEEQARIDRELAQVAKEDQQTLAERERELSALRADLQASTAQRSALSDKVLASRAQAIREKEQEIAQLRGEMTGLHQGRLDGLDLAAGALTMGTLADRADAMSATMAGLAARVDALDQSVSQHTHNGSGNFSWSDGSEKVQVKWTGGFRLSDDDKDIVWVEPGETVQVSDGGWLLSTGVEVKGKSDGTVEHSYYRNGFSRQYEPDGREFLATMLQKVVHRTGLFAPERVARFLKQGGVPAVLAEIDRMEGDYARRMYYGELFKQATLTPDQITTIAGKASRSISSDFELSSLLVTAAGQAKGDAGTLAALADATKTIESDFEQRRALTAIASGPADPKVATAVLTAAAGLGSDFERSSLLLAVVKWGGLTDETRGPFFKLVDGISSSFEQGKVLKAVLAQPSVSDAVMADVLASSKGMSGDFERRQVLTSSLGKGPMSPGQAKGTLEAAAAIGSDNERANLLVAFAKGGSVDAASAPAFFSAVSTMHSSFEQRRVIQAVLSRRDVPDAVMKELLKSMASVDGDFDRAELLVAIAQGGSLSPDARELFLKAADGIHSDFEQNRVYAALVRAERRGR